MNRTTLILGFLLVSLQIANAKPPDWKAKTGHRFAMVVYANVVDDSGKPLNHTGSLLSAGAGGKIRGVAPCSAGPFGPLYQLKVGSLSEHEKLTYRFYDGRTHRIHLIKKGPTFKSESIEGTIDNPVTIKIQK